MASRLASKFLRILSGEYRAENQGDVLSAPIGVIIVTQEVSGGGILDEKDIFDERDTSMGDFFFFKTEFQSF